MRVSMPPMQTCTPKQVADDYVSSHGPPFDDRLWSIVQGRTIRLGERHEDRRSQSAALGCNDDGLEGPSTAVVTEHLARTSDGLKVVLPVKLIGGDIQVRPCAVPVARAEQQAIRLRKAAASTSDKR